MTSLQDIRDYAGDIYRPNGLGDEYTIELLAIVDQVTSERDTARDWAVRLDNEARKHEAGVLQLRAEVKRLRKNQIPYGLKSVVKRIAGDRPDPHADDYKRARGAVVLDRPAEEIIREGRGSECSEQASRPSAYDMPVGSVVVRSPYVQYTRMSADPGGWEEWLYYEGIPITRSGIQADHIEGLFSDGLVTEWRLP